MTSRRSHHGPGRDDHGLPNLVVIGAMKCGTSSLHRYLDDHPGISMSRLKELNFFVGPGGSGAAADRLSGDVCSAGRWHLGYDWYRAQFRQDAAVRGEASPGYTSPDHWYVADRMAQAMPGARLIYLVRDPLARAVSQYRHHVRDGDERRAMEQALLDPHSQYIARSRYFERLEPFLERFPREQILIMHQDRLLHDRRQAMRRVYSFAGVDAEHWSDALEQRWNVGQGSRHPVPEALRLRFLAAVADDADRLRVLTAEPLIGSG